MEVCLHFLGSLADWCHPGLYHTYKCFPRALSCSVSHLFLSVPSNSPFQKKKEQKRADQQPSVSVSMRPVQMKSMSNLDLRPSSVLNA